MNRKDRIVRNKEILRFSEKGWTNVEIAKHFNVTNSTIGKALKDQGHIKKRGKTNRNEELLSLSLQGWNDTKVAKHFNISKQRVGQLLNDLGYDRKRIQKEIYEPIVIKFNKELKGNVCFYDVFKEIIKKGYNAEKLKKHGLKYNRTKLVEKRNRKIASVYKSGKTAKEILKSNVCGITTLGGVFQSIGTQGAQKMPKVKRGITSKAGTLYDDEVIMERIIKMRDKQKLTFKSITKILNEENIKTVGGNSFKMPNLVVKYNKYKKMNGMEKIKRFSGIKK